MEVGGGVRAADAVAELQEAGSLSACMPLPLSRGSESCGGDSSHSGGSIIAAAVDVDHHAFAITTFITSTNGGGLLVGERL